MKSLVHHEACHLVDEVVMLDLHVLVEGTLGAIRFLAFLNLAHVMPSNFVGSPPHSFPPLGVAGVVV